MEEIYKKADELVDLMYSRMISQTEAKLRVKNLIFQAIMIGLNKGKEAADEAIKSVFYSTPNEDN
jgi:16S rRNA C1402 N4-methylase RsmH